MSVTDAADDTGQPAFTFRQSIAADIPAWLRLLPHEMPLDADVRAELPAIWIALLREEAIEARTIVSTRGGEERVEAFGASLFLRPGLVDELIARPANRVAESIYRAMLDGARPVLSAREIAKANAGGGVDVCFVHFCEKPREPGCRAEPQLLALAHAAFCDAHFGYNVRTLVHQSFRPTRRAFLLASGMTLLHETVFGQTRERALLEPVGSTVSFLFRSVRPRYYFPASQRRVLRAALAGRSDNEIAAQLGVSRDAIKGTWKAILTRVWDYDIELAGQAATHRRRHVLEYVRQHPEELRPYERPSRAHRGSRANGRDLRGETTTA